MSMGSGGSNLLPQLTDIGRKDRHALKNSSKKLPPRKKQLTRTDSRSHLGTGDGSEGQKTTNPAHKFSIRARLPAARNIPLPRTTLIGYK